MIAAMVDPAVPIALPTVLKRAVCCCGVNPPEALAVPPVLPPEDELDLTAEFKSDVGLPNTSIIAPDELRQYPEKLTLAVFDGHPGGAS